MFRKRELKPEDNKVNNYEKDFIEGASKQKINTILKGSKLTGDINVSYDLELSGEVEGSISSEQNSNIVIQGVCKGNIKTREGNVTIEGELINGDITAGGDVKITGKFNGGMVKAKGKIYVNGEFKGKLEGNEVEIGPDARGKGEVSYNEYISVFRGAKVEVQISQIQEELKEIKKPVETKIVNIDRTTKEMSGLK